MAGAGEVGGIGGDAEEDPLAGDELLDDLLVAQPVLQGEHPAMLGQHRPQGGERGPGIGLLGEHHDEVGRFGQLLGAHRGGASDVIAGLRRDAEAGPVHRIDVSGVDIEQRDGRAAALEAAADERAHRARAEDGDVAQDDLVHAAGSTGSRCPSATTRANPGMVQVHPGDRFAAGRRGGKGVAPGPFGQGRVGVEDHAHVGMAELDRRHMHHVAPDQQRVAAIGDAEPGVTRAVTR